MTLSSSEAMYSVIHECVSYTMQEGYQFKEDELLFTYMPHKIGISIESFLLFFLDHFFCGLTLFAITACDLLFSYTLDYLNLNNFWKVRAD